MRKILLWIGHRAINGVTTGAFMLLFIAGITYAINLTSVTTQTVSAPWSADAGWYQQVNDRLVNIFASGTNIGIGTGAMNPTSPLTIVSDAVNPSWGSAMILLQQYPGASAAGTNPGVRTYVASGTIASPSYVRNNMYIGSYGAGGYWGGKPNNYFLSGDVRAYISMVADEDWTDSMHNGTRMEFTTTLNNSGSAIGGFLVLKNNGNVGIGMTTPAYRLDVGGDVINNGWYRSRGATGWYSETYGGGWHMSDTTWLRAYGNKSVYTAGQVRGDGGLCIGADCRTSWPGGSSLLGAEITHNLSWGGSYSCPAGHVMTGVGPIGTMLSSYYMTSIKCRPLP